MSTPETRRCEMPLPGADPDDPDGRCNTKFEPNHPTRKYCYDCVPAKKRIPRRRCKADGCDVLFTPKSENHRYHQQQCANRQKDRDYRERKRQERIQQAKNEGRLADAIEIEERADQAATAHIMRRVESILNVVNQRDSDGYHHFVESGLAERVRLGEFTQKTIAEALETEQKNVSVWMRWYQADRKMSEKRDEWEQPVEAAEAVFGRELTYSQLRDFIGEDIDAAIDKLVDFRARYFQDEEGRPYTTPRHMRRWLRRLFKAIVKGGRSVILAPPRHGKTMLLAHLAVWVIVQVPNIRILWVAGNADQAEETGFAIRDQLENNDELRAAYLPSGDTWKPKYRSGMSWTDAEFTIATRTVTGLRAPTWRAIGSGAKVINKDVDIGVGDDVVDMDDAYSPAEREKRTHWINTQFSSRKEAHTALCFIGSRQHHLDWYGDATENSAWDTLVDSAHDLNCELPPPHPHGMPEDHDLDCEECALHDDCVLWPGKRTAAFLQDQRAAMQNDTQYEMVYLNLTRPEGAVFLTRADLDGCCNLTRSIGTDQHGQPITPSRSGGLVLIAGLDPAATSDQAAVLWGYDPDTQVRYLIDTDIQRGGGLTGAEEIIKRWHQQYGLKHWVIERNRYQDAIMQASQITGYCANNGIHLQPHFTHAQNRNDPTFGIPYQMQLFKEPDRKIDLPWSPESPETREKVRVYMRQLLNFEGEELAKKRRRKNDLVLAGWFPENEIRHWRAELETEVQQYHGSTPYPSLVGEQYAYPGSQGSGISLAGDDEGATVHDIQTVRVA